MKSAFKKSIYILLSSFFASSFMVAQECTLDIGGKNFDMVVDIFQLNTEQQAVMEKLRAELEISNKSIEDEIQKLFNSHPQSTQAELISLSDKYKVLKEKMVNSSWESDKKLLETFNPKQYLRYENLCHEALRKPIKVTPTVYRDSISPE